LSVGARYGKLTVTRVIDGLTAECQCDCGKTITVSPMRRLKYGLKKSCGCLQNVQMRALKRASALIKP
jgi:hypothetical protein